MTRRVVLAGAAAGPFVITRPGWAQTGPVRLGYLDVLSGPNKGAGDFHHEVCRYAAERANAAGGLLGRRLEVIAADSELEPAVATQRAEDLLLGENVDALLVNAGSRIARAVAQVAYQHRRLLVVTGSEARQLTGEESFPTTFRCCLNTDQHSAQLAIYFARMAPTRYATFYLLNPDSAYGRAMADGFKKKFAQVKGSTQTIVAEEYHPMLTVKDFGPYIDRIMASRAEVLITGDFGQDLRLLLQQGAARGWTVRIGGFWLADMDLLRTVGQATVGHLTADAYLMTADTPENKEFIKVWHARFADVSMPYERYPVGQAAKIFYGLAWLGDVVKRAGTLETAKLIAAWEGATFRTPWGEVEMRACDHQMLTPSYVAEIREPASIPQEIRYFPGVPFLGPATRLAKEDTTIPPRETGNPRCAAGTVGAPGRGPASGAAVSPPAAEPGGSPH